jgi:hypothetical protein
LALASALSEMSVYLVGDPVSVINVSCRRRVEKCKAVL